MSGEVIPTIQIDERLRGSGRTTGRILMAIANALLCPDTWFAFTDHDERVMKTRILTRAMERRVRNTVERLGLKMDFALCWDEGQFSIEVRSPIKRMRAEREAADARRRIKPGDVLPARTIEAKPDGDTPQYTHDCEKCVFLGRFEDMDLYYADHGGLPDTVIARWGNDGPAYTSGKALAVPTGHPALYEAKKRAIAKGLMKDETQAPPQAATIQTPQTTPTTVWTISCRGCFVASV